MKVNCQGSVRVDLLGGPLDLNPINLILPEVITLNLATSLKADVTIEESTDGRLHIHSLDYNSEEIFEKGVVTYERLLAGDFGALNFVLQILFHQGITEGVKVTLKSGSPAGAGLGGSSAMGVTLFKAISNYKNSQLDREGAIRIVNSLEARILNKGPAGYQDYYPALFGGVLALKAEVGAVGVEQLYSKELVEALEEKLLLVFSGQSRLSGINNWEVYKSFFDDTNNVRSGLARIAKLSSSAFDAIKNKNFDELVSLIIQEGKVREELFPNILTPEMKRLRDDVELVDDKSGVKVCGAGGGGCFLVCCSKEKRSVVIQEVEKHGMTVLPFKVEAPL